MSIFRTQVYINVLIISVDVVLGGLHGRVSVLYASFTEFLVLYHAELETTGSTGDIRLVFTTM